jgi:hypothetical protein
MLLGLGYNTPGATVLSRAESYHERGAAKLTQLYGVVQGQARQTIYV